MSDIIDQLVLTTTLHTGNKVTETTSINDISQRIVDLIGLRGKKPTLIEVELPLPLHEIAARPMNVGNVAIQTPAKHTRQVVIHIQSRIAEAVKDELMYKMFLQDTGNKVYKLPEEAKR